MTPPNRSVENKTFPIKLGSAALIIFSTITTVASVMGTYYNLKQDIHDVSAKSDMQTQINNMRFNTLENNRTEDRGFLRSVSNRLRFLEQQQGINVDQKQREDHR